MVTRVSVSYEDDVVLILLRDRLFAPDFGEHREGGPAQVFGVIHNESDTDAFLFLRFAGHKNADDNGLAAYLIQAESSAEAVEEASKIYLSIKDGWDYHNRISLSALRPTSSWYPHFSQYEWRLLDERGEVAGLTCAHWYEVFLAFNDTESLERLAKFYQSPQGHTERLVEVVTDARILEHFASYPHRLLSATPREFEQLIAELLDRLGYKHIELSSPGRDGGVDITAYIEHAVAVERVIVQCKRYSLPNKVGEPTIKQTLDRRGFAEGGPRSDRNNQHSYSSRSPAC
ncbi:MAG: restriction endonuclease [Acidobacteriota bacterium]